MSKGAEEWLEVAEDWSGAAQRLERTPVVVKSSHPPTTNPTHADHSYNVGSPIILSNFFYHFPHLLSLEDFVATFPGKQDLMLRH